MTTGAGIYPGGMGPAGSDPVAAGYHVPRPKQPVAMRYEGATSDWVLDPSANYRAVTPVEQGMTLSLCVRQGDIKSSPTTGNTLHEITHLGGADLDSDIRNRVMASSPLARLVREKQAEVVRIDTEIGKQGFKVALYFKDLTADKSRVLRQDASIVS